MIEAKTLDTLFGTEASQFIQVTQTLIDEFEAVPVTYNCIKHAEFESIMRTDWKSASKIYWEELLGRAHLAAAASIIRGHRWSSGMAVSYANNLFLPYCASFRALIEAAADGYDALNNVALTLATCQKIINPVLQGKANRPVVASELEEQLIHFSHARKLSKGDSFPDSHNAKHAATYIQALEKAGLPGLYECYSELCQYTHPAAHSVVHLLDLVSEESFVLIPAHDQIRIEGMMGAHRTLLVPLLMYAFNPGALILKVLCYFDAPQFHSSVIKGIKLHEIKAWTKCAEKMGVQP